MRLYSLRSIIFSCLALTASVFLVSKPANAATVDLGPDVLQDYWPYHDVAVAIHDMSTAMDRLIVQGEAAHFLDNDRSLNLGSQAGERTPFGLPYYAESHATDGLNFIDLRRRC